MVLFHYTGHVPANTTELEPFHERVKMQRGTIIQWIPYQPDECADQVKFWVEYHGMQIFPWNRDEWAYGFFIPIPIPDKIDFNVPPYVLDFFAINEDDSFEHEYHVYVNVEPSSPVVIPTPSQSILDRFRSMLGGE